PTSAVVDQLAALGVAAMGFPWTVERIQRGGQLGLVATVRADREAEGVPATWAPVLDAALSTASVAFPGAPILRMPAHIHRVTLAPTPPARVRVTVRVTGADTVDVQIAELDGTVVGTLSRLRYGVLDNDDATVANPHRLVHEIVWRPGVRKDTVAAPN